MGCSTLEEDQEAAHVVNLLPNPEIFEVTRFSATEAKSRMHETAYLNPQLSILFEDPRVDVPER